MSPRFTALGNLNAPLPSSFHRPACLTSHADCIFSRVAMLDAVLTVKEVDEMLKKRFAEFQESQRGPKRVRCSGAAQEDIRNIESQLGVAVMSAANTFPYGQKTQRPKVKLIKSWQKYGFE